MTSGIVDTHVHVWDIVRFPLPWLDAADPPLPGRAGFGGLDRALARADVGAAVVVQAGTTEREARWLVEGVTRSVLARAVVLQVAPDSDGWPAWAEALIEANRGLVRGIRLPIRAARPDLTDLPALSRLIEGILARGLVLELLIRPHHLDAVARIAERFPAAPIVLCHLGGFGETDPEHGLLRSLQGVARHENVSAKVSGFLPREQVDAGALCRLRPVVRSAADTFGADRLMFGSDWPVSTAIRTYDDVLEITTDALGDLGRRGGAIMAETAKRVYGLKEGASWD